MEQERENSSVDVSAARVDPLHETGSVSARWTTVNTAEGLPGVATPLGLSWYNQGCEYGARKAFSDIGALPAGRDRPSSAVANVDECFVAGFCGRAATNVDSLRRVADQIPGSSGDAFEEKYFGKVRGAGSSSKSVRRYPVVVAKLPAAVWGAKRRLGCLEEKIDGWWRECVAPGSTVSDDEARARFREALHYWCETVRVQGVLSMMAVGCYEQLQKICQAAGKPGMELRLMNGTEDVYEARVIHDLWDVAHGGTSIDSFLLAHGYHGPAEGELSSRSWREDPAPLVQLVEAYRRLDPQDRPPTFRGGAGEGLASESELLAALGTGRRQVARLVLRLTRAFVPLREEARGTFLKAYDVARCMARRIGDSLVASGRLEDREDVFYLTVDELLGSLPADLKGEIAFRRARRDGYLLWDLPEHWTGQPDPLPVATEAPGADGSAEDSTLVGVGASVGVVEGRALVVTDPDHSSDVQSGDILVCHTTDPSWAALFFLVSACVVDIGGAMSHGAIVARELGLPCVINTRDGTRRLRTGDLIRVDGSAGTVEIVTRAEAPHPA